MSNKTLDSLKTILDKNKDKCITIIGTTCTGKTTLMKDIAEAVSISELTSPLTGKEKEFVNKTPWTKEIGEKVFELKGKKAIVVPGHPAFGTVFASNSELLVYLQISDNLLKERVKQRNVNFSDAKAMQLWIEEKIKKSSLPVIVINIE